MPYIRRVRVDFDRARNRPIYAREVVTAGGAVLFSDPCDPKTCSDRDVILMHYAFARPDERPRS